MSDTPTNKIITIGYLGHKIAYLNVPREEAIRRYCEEDGTPREQVTDGMISEFEFIDQFYTYEAGA